MGRSEKDNPTSIDHISLPPLIIWGSSLLIGLLSIVPRIRNQGIDFYHVLADYFSAAVLSLCMWFFYRAYFKIKQTKIHFGRLVAWSILLSFTLMMFIVYIYHLVFDAEEFNYLFYGLHFKGFLINMLLLVILYSLLQEHKARVYSAQLAEVKSKNLQAQFHSLRQQVKPHFLFNSLNILKTMIENQDTKAPDLVMKLSDFYRFTLSYNTKNTIRLEEELHIMNAYAYLLQARFEDAFKLEVDIDRNALNSILPPFTLQILLENVVKHNMGTIDKPLFMQIRTEGDFIIVRNSLQPKRKKEASTQMGLKNIELRYKHLSDLSMQAQKDNNHFTVKLPLVYGNPDH